LFVPLLALAVQEPTKDVFVMLPVTVQGAVAFSPMVATAVVYPWSMPLQFVAQ
jgi:hypothetical protein